LQEKLIKGLITNERGLESPLLILAAAAAVVAATVIAAATSGHQTVAATAAEQDQQNDDPAPVPTTTVITHNEIPPKIFQRSFDPLIPTYSIPNFLCNRDCIFCSFLL